jgi:hypothetical protein
MLDKHLSATLFPSPSNELIEQAKADAPGARVWSWMQALPRAIKQCLSSWQIESTGESLKQGYFSYSWRVGARKGRRPFLSSARLCRKHKNK